LWLLDFKAKKKNIQRAALQAETLKYCGKIKGG